MGLLLALALSVLPTLFLSALPNHLPPPQLDNLQTWEKDMAKMTKLVGGVTQQMSLDEIIKTKTEEVDNLKNQLSGQAPVHSEHSTLTLTTHSTSAH